MTPISKPLAKQLAKDLRAIVQRWERNPRRWAFTAGICRAVADLGEADSYGTLRQALIGAQGHLGGFMEPIEDVRYSFKQDRALMCLFLAEWLQTEVLEAK